MQRARQLMGWLNAPVTLWLVLAWPSFPLVWDLFEDNRYYAEIMHLTGVLSTQLLVLTLAITPFTLFAKRWPIGRVVSLWLLKRRRYLGVAAFGYGFLHLIFYIRETNSLNVIYLEFFDLAFSFGWLGFLFLLPPFLTSNRLSIRQFRDKWKTLQRLSYIAVIAVFIHWLYFDFFWDEALSWLAVLVAVKVFHVAYRYIFASFARI